LKNDIHSLIDLTDITYKHWRQVLLKSTHLTYAKLCFYVFNRSTDLTDNLTAKHVVTSILRKKNFYIKLMQNHI